MRTAIELIADERRRQIEVEGWTHEHDDNTWMFHYKQMRKRGVITKECSRCGGRIEELGCHAAYIPITMTDTDSRKHPLEVQFDELMQLAHDVYPEVREVVENSNLINNQNLKIQEIITPSLYVSFQFSDNQVRLRICQ